MQAWRDDCDNETHLRNQSAEQDSTPVDSRACHLPIPVTPDGQMLRSFVTDGTTNFICDLCWNFIHVMGCARMFCRLAHDVLVSFALRHEVAVHAHVSTAHCFRHVDLLSDCSFAKNLSPDTYSMQTWTTSLPDE